MLRLTFATLLAAAAATAVNAASVTFHLIAPTPTATKLTPSVNINGGSAVVMTAPQTDVPHYTAVVDIPAGATYKYTIGGYTEPFDRVLVSGRSETYNDFFNRTVTVSELPPFPWPLQDEGFSTAQWQRAAPSKPLFDDSYVGTLYFSGAAADNVQSADATVTLYVILKDQILAFPSTIWMMYKEDTWKYGTLFQITQNQDKIGGRTMFKLRTGEFDPTNLREKTYTDLSVALGVPVAQQAHFRVYSNGKPLGLFVLTDLVTNSKDITDPGSALGQANHAFHVFEGGKPERLASTGPLLVCGTGATFEYKNDDPNSYAACWGYQMGITNPKMVEFAKTLNAVDAANQASIDAFDKIFDIDTFLRQMVLEYLTVNWDAYWDQSSNFAMYLDSNTKWWFTDNDFDQTFGSANDYSDGPEESYKTYPSRKINHPGGTRPLIEKLLKVPKYAARFELILVKTVKHTFNPVAFNRRIDAFVTKLRPEMQWDHSFKSDSADPPRLFSFAGFDQGLVDPVTYLPPQPNNTGVGNGLKTWVARRAAAVAGELNFQWDTTVIDPPTNLVAGSTATTVGSSDATKATVATSAPAKANANASSAPSLSTSLSVVGIALAAVISVFLLI